MNNRRTKTVPFDGLEATPITTTLMELVEALSCVATDDRMVTSTMKDIFNSHRVRLARSSAPVRLVECGLSQRTPRFNRSRKRAAWA